MIYCFRFILLAGSLPAYDTITAKPIKVPRALPEQISITVTSDLEQLSVFFLYMIQPETHDLHVSLFSAWCMYPAITLQTKVWSFQKLFFAATCPYACCTELWYEFLICIHESRDLARWFWSFLTCTLRLSSRHVTFRNEIFHTRICIREQ